MGLTTSYLPVGAGSIIGSAGCRSSDSRRVTRPSTSAAVSSGATSALTVIQVWPSRRASESSGTISDAAAKPFQGGELPPSGANAKPPKQANPDPGGPLRESTIAPATSARQRAATWVKRSGPWASSARTHPSAATATPSRSGCSEQNQ